MNNGFLYKYGMGAVQVGDTSCQIMVRDIQGGLVASGTTDIFFAVISVHR